MLNLIMQYSFKLLPQIYINVEVNNAVFIQSPQCKNQAIVLQNLHNLPNFALIPTFSPSQFDPLQKFTINIGLILTI